VTTALNTASDFRARSIMRAEIAEQPEALQRTLDALLPLAADVAVLAGPIRHVLFVGRGTSDNAAVYGMYLLQAFSGRLATLGSPSVSTAYRARIDLGDTLVVGVSQSGRTGEIVETLAWARDCGARTLAVTNDGASPLAESADLALVTQAGTEHAVPATKTFTCQLAAMAVLAVGLGADVDPGELTSVPDEAARLLGEAPAADVIAADLAGVRGVVVSARGLAYAASLELALKLEEACYLPAIGLSGADLLHGPIAMVDDQVPAIVLAADTGPTLAGTAALARRVKDLGARVYGIGGGAVLGQVCTRVLDGPRLPEWLAPIGLIVPGQLLTEALAIATGLNPDRPRSLTKVTQTA
jgi:glucosamine--fructose-6-phosphate aminotransferase (isomerizing)